MGVCDHMPCQSRLISGTTVLACFLFACLPHSGAQSAFSFNALADLELSRAGEKSHYYYNEIDQEHTDWRLGISQLNLIGKWRPDSNWSFNVRFLLERDKGQKLDRFSTPQLNIQWLSGNRKFGATVGYFPNPFGSFNSRQLSTQRNFIGLPLAYAYYGNISPGIGYMPGMGDITKVMVDGQVQWGGSMLYYGGYTAGAMFSWNIRPAKVNWKVAIVNGAANTTDRFSKPISWGVVTRLKLQPAYFWEQGVSLSHGSFMQESEVSTQLAQLGTYTQTLIGTDFKVGTGFFEFSGEVIGAFYRVPQFESETGTFEMVSTEDPLNVSSLSAYLDVKYEIPMIQGSYVAYRIDHLGFGKPGDATSGHWDNRVLRHSLAIGYHLNRYLLGRMAVSTQHVDQKPWDTTQRTFRFVLTAHY